MCFILHPDESQYRKLRAELKRGNFEERNEYSKLVVDKKDKNHYFIYFVSKLKLQKNELL